MVTMQQVKTGLVKYIDTDVLTHLTGIKKLGLGVYTALAANNVVGLMEKYREHPAVAVLDVIDAEGNVDIDKLYQAVAPQFANGEKQTISIPLIGDMTVDRTDLEKLYRYIKG